MNKILTQRHHPPQHSEDDRRRRADRRRQDGFPVRRLCRSGRTGSDRRQARLHRADRFRAADHRQGKGPLRKARACRMSRSPSRPPGARRATIWCSAAPPTASTARISSRRMPYLMHTGKVTQNNQPVPMAHPGPPELRQPGDLGRQGICRYRRPARFLQAEGRLREEEGRGRAK